MQPVVAAGCRVDEGGELGFELFRRCSPRLRLRLRFHGLDRLGAGARRASTGFNFVQPSASDDAVRFLFHDISITARELVPRLEEQPALVFLAVAAGLGSHEVPAAAQLVPLDRELEVPLRVSGSSIANRRPGALVPDHHGASAILPLRDRALEVRVVERVRLGLLSQALHRGIEARAFRDRPAEQYAVELQTKVVVEPTRCVLLDHVAELGAALARRGFAGRFARLGKIPLLSVGSQTGHGAPRAHGRADAVPMCCATSPCDLERNLQSTPPWSRRTRGSHYSESDRHDRCRPRGGLELADPGLFAGNDQIEGAKNESCSTDGVWGRG